MVVCLLTVQTEPANYLHAHLSLSQANPPEPLLLISAPHSSEDYHDPWQSLTMRCCGNSYPRGIWAGIEKPFLVIALYLRGRPGLWWQLNLHILCPELCWAPTQAPLVPSVLPSKAKGAVAMMATEQRRSPPSHLVPALVPPAPALFPTKVIAANTAWGETWLVSHQIQLCN